jgi:hypothetical protein
MFTFDEDGLPEVSANPVEPVEVVEEPRVAGTFQQRLYRSLVDLADIIAVQGYFTQDELVEVINKWSTDPPLPKVEDVGPEAVTAGLDQIKLYYAIGHQNSSEAEIEEAVLNQLKAADNEPDWENMDQIDFAILEQEAELAKNSQGVAYLTAVLNQDPVVAHEIIDEMGCSLTHLLTAWFFMYMSRHEDQEEGLSDNDIVRKRVATMGMENAKAASMTKGQRRERMEEQIERWKRMTGFYDQDEDSGPDVS